MKGYWYLTFLFTEYVSFSIQRLALASIYKLVWLVSGSHDPNPAYSGFKVQLVIQIKLRLIG